MVLKQEELYLPISTQRPRRQRRGRALALGLLCCVLSYAIWGQWHSCGQHCSAKPVLFGKAAEKAFLSIPDPKSAIAASRLYASKPHMAGTPQDGQTALDFLELLQTELGIPAPDHSPIYSAGSPESREATLSSFVGKPKAWIDTYYPILNTPLERALQIVDETGGVLWEGNLSEQSDDTDPDAAQYADAIPAFHGLSVDGDVAGQVVDGNDCTKEDYDALNISLEGKIVLCRYGKIFRGLKVKGGQELGAAGVLIYSDPKDDGTVTVEQGYQPYPYGPARNPTSVQRGSVQFISIYPGDPTTPGYPSYENSTRTEPFNIPKIPSLPISWTNAQAILRTLDQDDPLFGRKVRLVNHVENKITPIWNTMGVIPGFMPEEVVVVGNHRDAWVLGATDPTSGTASIHEVIRGLGHLLRNGWKPLRTILIASWDAEEYGLIGSTEWGEDFSDWIEKHVVTYLNLDSSVSGSRFKASGSPLLAHFIRNTAEDVLHPTDENRTLWDATLDDGKLHGWSIPQDSSAVPLRDERHSTATDSVGVSPLGSGSDYTVFLQRIGIPSGNEGFGATVHDPVYHYHSVFDSERWQEIYGDEGFFRHTAISRHIGLQLLRLSSSPVLPLNTTHYAAELESYLDQVEDLAVAHSLNVGFASLRKSIHSLQKASIRLDEERQEAGRAFRRLLDKWRKKSANDQRIRRMALGAWCKVKGLEKQECYKKHAALNSQDGLDDEPESFEAILGLALHSDVEIDDMQDLRQALGYSNPDKRLKRLEKILKKIRQVNRKALAFERGFISKEGIKGREWYRHLGVAPGKWLGYGATTFPALTEAITIEKNATLARHESDRLEKLIKKLTAHVGS